MRKKVHLLVGITLMFLFFTGCTSIDYNGVSANVTSKEFPSTSEASLSDELLVLDGESNCERYNFRIRHPSSWTAIVDEESFETPDQGIRIYIDNNEDAFIYAFGDSRGLINPGMAGNKGHSVSNFSFSSGISGKMYSCVGTDEILWKTAIFGHNDKYAIILKVDCDIYKRLEPTINAIMNSFEFTD